jgi:hypothetical protein
MTGSSGTRDQRDVVLAWVSLVGFVFSFLAAFFVGEGLASWFGYPVGTDVAPPAWVAVAATVPALVVFAIPGILAWFFGRRARRAGDQRGLLPAWIGVAVAAAFALLNGVAAVVPGM